MSDQEKIEDLEWDGKAMRALADADDYVLVVVNRNPEDPRESRFKIFTSNLTVAPFAARVIENQVQRHCFSDIDDE